MYKLFISDNLNTKELLKYVFEKYKIDEEVCYNEYGKPFLNSHKLYFSLSNTLNYSVCAISNKEIGVDIERICYKERVIDRVFTENEKKIIKNDDDFTKIWVKKEAFMKWNGMGASYGFKNIDTTKLKFIVKKYNDCYIGIYNE